MTRKVSGKKGESGYAHLGKAAPIAKMYTGTDRKDDLDKMAENQVYANKVAKAPANGDGQVVLEQNDHADAPHKQAMATDKIQTFAPGAPVTASRPLNGYQDVLPDSAMARANLAITKEVPDGGAEANVWHGPDSSFEGKTYKGTDPNTRTVLQKHLDYFDQDKDGYIWPQDTYRGFHDMGFNIFISLLGAVIITVALAYPTSQFFPLPDPFFRINTKQAHKIKHGSDSGSYDTEGRFEPTKFEEIFLKYDKDHKGGLTKGEIWQMISGNRVAMDPFGAAAGFLEWYATYLLVWPEDKVLRKEDARATIDGSIFYRMAEKKKEGRRGPRNNVKVD